MASTAEAITLSPPHSILNCRAKDLAELPDEELVALVDTNGWSISNVYDPENLPRSTINKLMERFDARDMELPASSFSDLFGIVVGAYYAGMSPPPRDSAQSPSSEPSTMASMTRKVELIKEQLSEYKSYIELENSEIPPPWYPIDQLMDVSSNPELHVDLLEYWKDEEPKMKHFWAFFCKQWARWQKFLKWQRDIRRTAVGYIQVYSEIACQRLEVGNLYYTLLFKADPEEQARLLDWLEYMLFELNIYRRWSWAKHQEAWDQEQRAYLARDCKLEADETADRLHTNAWAVQHLVKGTKAQSARETARIIVQCTEQQLMESTTDTEAANEAYILALQSLHQAEADMDAFKVKNQYVLEFRRRTEEYYADRQEAERHDVLRDWLRKKIPVIKEEVREAGEATAAQQVPEPAVSNHPSLDIVTDLCNTITAIEQHLKKQLAKKESEQDQDKQPSQSGQ